MVWMSFIFFLGRQEADLIDGDFGLDVAYVNVRLIYFDFFFFNPWFGGRVYRQRIQVKK